jgi:methylated-DNA-[protein]-cysteine S-methyltransferase
MKQRIFKTALGWAGVIATDRGICGIVLPRKNKQAVARALRDEASRVRLPEDPAKGGTDFLEQTVRLLQRYFNGEEVLFDLPLDLRYYTPFQRSVWRAAAGIPFGETRSYQWIAERINKPRAARAVGQAVGANPVPVVIPCHRVITSAGTLGGFSGGLELKKKLLRLESHG